MTNLPQNGQIITFRQVAPGSYCRTGEAYRVERIKNKGDFRFVSIERGSSTYDRPNMVARAIWSATE